MRSSNFNLAKELADRTDADWRFGALSQPGIVSIPAAEREAYLPVGETQFDQYTDFTDCASRSPVNFLESLFTYHYQHAMLPENKKWMEDQGYANDGKITFSDRFVAVGSGTTHGGNSLKAPLDFIYRSGLIPKKLLPKTDTMTWDQYYAPIPQNLKDLGKEFLKRFTINYEQVAQIHFADVLKDDCLGVAGYAWPAPDANDVYHSSSDAFNHAFLIYNLPKYQIFDNYMEAPGDFTKNLAPDYKLYEYGYRVYVSAEKKSPDDEAEEVGLWQKLVDLLTQLRDYLLTTQQAPIPTPAPTNTLPPSNMLGLFALAIQKFEGYTSNPPSRSFRNCNPGNTRFSAVGYAPIYLPVRRDPDNFAIFKNYQTGFLYLRNLILSKCKAHPEWDLYTFFGEEHDGWAPDSDGNNSRHYAEVVAQALGVAPNWKVGNLLA